MDKLNTLVTRLNKLNIDIELSCNWPWVYIKSVNGSKVVEKNTQHGYTIYYESSGNFKDTKEMFELIRSYNRMDKLNKLVNKRS